MVGVFFSKPAFLGDKEFFFKRWTFMGDVLLL